MKKTSLLVAAAVFMLTGIKGQDCSSVYFPQNEGVQLEYSQYDRNDNLTGTLIQKVSEIRQISNGVEADIDIETYNAGGNMLGEAQISVRCEDGVYYMDMENYLNQESMQAMEDMEMTIEGESLEFPSDLKAGDELKGSEMTVAIGSGGMTMMSISITMSNRKVEAVEGITTSAGTFECYKISYDITTQVMGAMKNKGIEWYAKDVGMVKSETYDDSGNLSAYTLLTSLKQ